MKPAQTSHCQGQERQEDHAEPNKTAHPHLNGTIQFNDEHEKSVSIDRVLETCQ